MQNLDEVEFSVTNKNFSYIGYILLFISVSIIFSSLFSISPTEEYLITNVGLGIIGSMVGVFFILYGLKKKQILIGNNNLIYFSSGKKCVISFQSIEYIHTFYDKTNHSTNLLILFDKDQSISFSSSFWTEEKLQVIFKMLLKKLNTVVDFDLSIIQNDLKW